MFHCGIRTYFFFLVLCIHSVHKQRQTNEVVGHFYSATDQNMPSQVVSTDVALLKNHKLTFQNTLEQTGRQFHLFITASSRMLLFLCRVVFLENP